jgi:diguanylate cyclase (GGDEF)-like protein
VLTLGMVGAGFFWMALSAALASVLHSLRAGMGVALFSSAVLTATGLGFVSGWLMVPFDLNAHAASRSAWASYLAVTIAVPFVMLYAIGGFQKTVLELLARLHAQRDQLLVQRELLDRQRDQLEIQASHDTLTGLPVTRLAMARLQAALDNAIRSGERTALLFIDLDGFKAVNDTQGHDVGDLVLQEVARRLRAVVRAEDTVARIGGDEFLAILAQPGSGEASTAAVADALIKAVSRPMQAAGVTVSVGASIGVAICPDHAADLPGLRRLADAAMYQAKRSGKNRHCFATAPAPARA